MRKLNSILQMIKCVSILYNEAPKVYHTKPKQSTTGATVPGGQVTALRLNETKTHNDPLRSHVQTLH